MVKLFIIVALCAVCLTVNVLDVEAGGHGRGKKDKAAKPEPTEAATKKPEPTKATTQKPKPPAATTPKPTPAKAATTQKPANSTTKKEKFKVGYFGKGKYRDDAGLVWPDDCLKVPKPTSALFVELSTPFPCFKVTTAMVLRVKKEQDRSITVSMKCAWDYITCYLFACYPSYDQTSKARAAVKGTVKGAVKGKTPAVTTPATAAVTKPAAAGLGR